VKTGVEVKPAVENAVVEKVLCFRVKIAFFRLRGLFERL
jgi:hypothetical protein